MKIERSWFFIFLRPAAGLRSDRRLSDKDLEQYNSLYVRLELSEVIHAGDTLISGHSDASFS